MKKLLLLLIINPILLFSQVQIGQDIDGETAGDNSGISVSLSSNGSVLAVGAQENDGNGSDSGHVRIFKNESGTWIQVGSDIDGEAAGDKFGSSVSLSSDGSVIAIGATDNTNENNGNSGHVRVYRNLSDVWTQIGSDIDGEAAGDRFGASVSLSSGGNIVAVGANANSGNGFSSGHVRVYENQSDVWTQIGSDINGEAASDRSGGSISLSSDGTVVAIGATFNDGNGNRSGHVRVYRNVNDVWIQIGSDIDGEELEDRSGYSVSLSADGNVVAIGALLNNGNGSFSGHVRIYRNVSDVWTQIGSDIDGEAAGDISGSEVSLSSDGNIVAIGAPFNNGSGSLLGHVRIYRNLNDTWTQVGLDIDGEATADQSGRAVSLSSDGSVVAIGADFNDGNGTDSGHVRVYNLNSVLSSEEFVLSSFISMFPNPAKEKVVIELEQDLELQSINIYNNLGQFISNNKNQIIDISNLTTGVYFLKIETNKGKAIKKLVVE